MEESLGVNGRQLFVRVDCNLGEWEHVLLVQCFISLHNTFYGRSCNFHNGLIKWFCILLKKE